MLSLRLQVLQASNIDVYRAFSTAITQALKIKFQKLNGLLKLVFSV